MARTPDKPGKYRVKQKGLEWVLSGVRMDGRRVRLHFGSETEAKENAGRLFGSEPTAPLNQKLDEWGIPVSVDFPNIGPETVNAVASAMGIPTADAKPETPKVDDKKAEENRKRAKSLCEFLGIAWASGDVWLARKMTTSLGKDPLNPSKSQVNTLADAAQTALTDLFGDRQVGPWTMAILLSIALPVSMMLQSPPKKKEDSQQGVKTDATSEPGNLRAV
jgi:hypothetical protein